MPARIHAVIVARSGATTRGHLLRTIDALSHQTRRPDAVTLVFCGDATTVRESPAVTAAVSGIIEARAGTSFADAVALAQPRIDQDSSLWILAHDTVPSPAALAQLSGALERSPSAAIAAPKLLKAEDEHAIASFGVTMTTLGRSVELAAGELDQGQHDGSDEALGADIRGMLIRSEVREHLTIDPALAGADEGLDLGVRARLGGGRVVLASGARVVVEPNGPAALPMRPSQRAYATRRAQLHRRLAYAPALAVPLQWLALLPLALWRTIGHLIGKRPAAVLPEWAAAAAAMVSFAGVARARRRIRSFRSVGWSSVAALRVTGSALRRRLDDGHGTERGAVSELRFFSGGGAWAVLGAVVASIAVFTSLLAWSGLDGGGLLPLRDTVAGLWQDAAWGLRGLGIDIVGPADPFAAVIAVIGTLWPAAPSYSLVLVWLLALPLAVLGGWFAATRLTDRSGLRIFVGLAWALAPTFLTALMDGRPAAVIVHLLLPWLFHSAAVAHRSWGAAGAASILLIGVVACAPSLAPALAVLWVIALIIVLAQRRIHGSVRLLWVLVPTAVLFLPLLFWHIAHGSLLSILADPGYIWDGAQVQADAAGRSILATGFPTADLGDWMQTVDPALAAWAPVLLVPIVLLALAAAFAPRWRSGFVLLAVALAGVGTAFAAVGIAISFTQGTPVAIWPGTGLSLAWVGVVGAAAVALDTLIVAPRARAASAVVAALALGVCAVPSLAAMHAGRSVLVESTGSTLPALIAANARGDQDMATLIITPLTQDAISTRVVWGSSETLGAQTTMSSTATTVQGTDVSALAVDLVSARDFDAAADLADLGIDFVLVDELTAGAADEAVASREEAVIALDQRSGFVRAGDIEGIGSLWRLDRVEATTQGQGDLSIAEQGIMHSVAILQVAVVLIALLLAVPTRASRRAARTLSRIVGKTADEPPLPPRRRREHHGRDDHEESSPDDDAQDTEDGDVRDAPQATQDAGAPADPDADAVTDADADPDADAVTDTDSDADAPAGPDAAEPASDPDPTPDPDTAAEPEHETQTETEQER